MEPYGTPRHQMSGIRAEYNEKCQDNKDCHICSPCRCNQYENNKKQKIRIGTRIRRFKGTSGAQMMMNYSEA